MTDFFPWRFEITRRNGARVTFVAQSQAEALKFADQFGRQLGGVRVRIWKVKP